MKSGKLKLIIAVLAVILALSASSGVALAYFSDYEPALGERTLLLNDETQIEEEVTDTEKTIKIVRSYLLRCYRNGSDMEARSGMSLGATCAGMALLGAGCAGCHCLAYSIENKYHIVHGMANASMMPYVTRFNAIAKPEKYAKVAEALGENIQGLSAYEAALKAADAFEKLNELFKIPKIHEYGVTEDDIEAFADEAMANGRLRPQNPRTLTKEDCIAIYKAAF